MPLNPLWVLFNPLLKKKNCNLVDLLNVDLLNPMVNVDLVTIGLSLIKINLWMIQWLLILTRDIYIYINNR